MANENPITQVNIVYKDGNGLNVKNENGLNVELLKAAQTVLKKEIKELSPEPEPEKASASSAKKSGDAAK